MSGTKTKILEQITEMNSYRIKIKLYSFHKTANLPLQSFSLLSFVCVHMKIKSQEVPMSMSTGVHTKS